MCQYHDTRSDFVLFPDYLQWKYVIKKMVEWVTISFCPQHFSYETSVFSQETYKPISILGNSNLFGRFRGAFL